MEGVTVRLPRFFSKLSPASAAIIPVPTAQVLPPGGIQQIRGITPADWFSPLQPIPSTAPADLLPRRYQYTPGSNLIFTPRGEEAISFEVLRGLSQNYDLLRMVIQRAKDLVCIQPWSIRLKSQPGETNKQRLGREAKDVGVRFLTQFFECPDTEHDWPTWLGMLLEDMYVLDAANVWVERLKATGKPIAFRPLDGATITRYIDEQGFTPKPPNQAYSQVLYGQPAVPMTAADLLYLVRNQITGRHYGYSHVEQVIVSINIALRREMFQLNYYTEGNVPEALYTMPPNVTVDQVKEFQDWFDSVLAGNLSNRRRIRFIPGDDTGKQRLMMTKEALLKDEMDDWLASIFCFQFGVSRQGLIKQMNRASAEQSADSSEEEGLAPAKLWVRSAVNRMIQTMGFAGYELVFNDAREVDVLKQAQADKIYVGIVKHINEIRAGLGLDPDPSPEANMLGSFTPDAGFVPIGTSPDYNGEDDNNGDQPDDSAPKESPTKVRKKKVTTRY